MKIAISLGILILFSACSINREMFRTECTCSDISIRNNWEYNSYWRWNEPVWGWGNQIVIIPQRFRDTPVRYNRPTGRTIQPTPPRRNYDRVYPKRREPSIQRNTPTVPQNIRPQRSSPSPNRITPNRTTTPSRGGSTSGGVRGSRGNN